MASLYAPPLNYVVAGSLVLVGMYAAARSARLITRGLREARALDVVRGIRVCVLALVADLCAIGVLATHTGFVIVAALILGEELYETGVLALIVRAGEGGGDLLARRRAR